MIDQAFFNSLSPASFGGRPFSVEQFDGQHGHQVAEQTAIGIGTRVLPRALRLQTTSFRAYLSSLDANGRGRDVLKELDILLRALDNPSPQTLIHPWRGALPKHICTEARYRVHTGHVRYVELDLSFAPATFPEPVRIPATVPRTGAQALDTMAELASGFVTEPAPAAELERVSEQLNTRGESLSATVQQTSAKLLIDGNLAVSGVPGVVQSMGHAVRVVQAGEYTESARARLFSATMNIACARNSSTLLKLLQVFKLYLSALGGGALASSVTVMAGSLQSLARHHGRDSRILAARNRQTVRQWFPNGEVRL